MLNRIVIIAAGGTGSRLNKNLPKQYMLLDGKPVLMHTIELFEKLVDKIVVSIHPDMFEYWNELCIQYNFKIKHEIVFGGKTRFQSVKNALAYTSENYNTNLSNETLIAIHDAARPLTDQHLIEKSFILASEGKSNVLAMLSTNSIRLGTADKSSAIDRSQVWQIQTPQTFQTKTLFEAYNQDESDLFTDDASVVEKLGYPIHLIESTPRNLKLTYAEDFEIAKLYLSK